MDLLKPESRRSMRSVCIVRRNYYPDSHVRRDAEAIAGRGFQVFVVALRRPGQPPRETIGGVNVVRLPVEHHRGSIVYCMWEYLWFLILAFATVTALHLRHRFKIVEIDNMPDVLVLSALVPKILGARVLFYIFDTMPELLAYTRCLSFTHPFVRLSIFVEQFCARLADEVVVTQEIPRRAVEARGVSSKKLHVVLNSADEAIFRRPHPLHAHPGGGLFEIVSHGSILERYGIQVLIEALPRIVEQIPNVQVQIFGEGEYRRSLEDLARRNGVSDRVQFRGLVPIEELVDSVASADVGYVGMLNDLVLPNKLMEYVVLGVPVVLARWPTFEYYFPDDSVAYFEPGNANHLADTILSLNRDPERGIRLVKRATEVGQEYRWPVQRERYLRIYETLLSRETRGKSGLRGVHA